MARKLSVRRGVLVGAFVALLAEPLAHGGQAWLEAGDAQLRNDLMLLADEDVIALPLTSWPVPVADIERVLAKVDSRKIATSALQAALDRVTRAVRPDSSSALHLAFIRAAAGQPSLLREFDTHLREEGELGMGIAMLGNRWAAEVQATGVASSADGQSVRLDGSHITARFGNWLFSANALDRWWGPGWQGSLLLSSNARPVPAFSLDRATSEPFNIRGLRWLGPWRLTTFMGQMENHRQDRDHPLLFGMRVSFQPADGLEIALERTAQWCARGLPCGLQAFNNLFFGHDNQGENVRPEDEPGNQLAGWSIRWASPIGHASYALYNQHIGETIDNHIPRPLRSLELFGAELWGERVSGTTWRAYIEHADTTCGSDGGTPQFNCAYGNTLFNHEGYRYRGRTLGYSTDNDALVLSVGLLITNARGVTASALARYGTLNRGGNAPDPLNLIADRPTELRSLQAAVQLPRGPDSLRLGVGFDHTAIKSTDRSRDEVHAFLEWRRDF